MFPYRSVPQIRPPPAFLAESLAEGISFPRISPRPRRNFHAGSKSPWRNDRRKNEASMHRTDKHFSIDRKLIATRLSTVKLSTANADRPQQRWTRQLLCGSALLPRPSTLKLASLPLASVASLRLAFYARRRLALRTRPPPPFPAASILLHSRVQGLRGRMAAQERSQHPQNR